MFSKTTICTRPAGLVHFWSSLQKCTRAYLFQIALEIMWLPLQISIQLQRERTMETNELSLLNPLDNNSD